MRKPIKKITTLLGILCIASSLNAQDSSTNAAVEDAPSSFVGFREVEGEWYHPPEFAGDPDAAVYRSVYQRIASTNAKRLNSEELDTVISYGPGHWTYEWEQEAARAMSNAIQNQNSGNAALASKEYERASKFFARGSWPHLKSDEAAMKALTHARAAYAAGADLLPGQFEVIDIPFEGKSFGSYLFTPPGEGPFPVAVVVNGTDVVKEQLGFGLPKELLARGIAMLAIDLAGVGDSGNYTLTHESEMIPLAASKYIKSHSRIDPEKVALMGVSVGGHAAARALFRQDSGLKAILSHCAPLHFPFANGVELVPHLPKLTVDGFLNGMGLAPDTPAAQFGEALKAFSLPNQGLVNTPPVSMPLLVVTTKNDPVAPLEDLKYITEATDSSGLVVIDEPGHCPAYWEINALSASWLSDIFKTL
ncbi:esterase FrsA [Agrobacterium vitis]|nr:esterase FrsA [Agrobacterium vitis]MBE1440331.1 esterase FrsA [Agrobacterium vitis]